MTTITLAALLENVISTEEKVENSIRILENNGKSATEEYDRRREDLGVLMGFQIIISNFKNNNAAPDGLLTNAIKCHLTDMDNYLDYEYE